MSVGTGAGSSGASSSGAGSKLSSIAELLTAAERLVALLSRCVPVNALSERQRLAQAWQNGTPTAGAGEPRWQIAPAPPLGEVRRALAHVVREAPSEELGSLYGERAEELLLEAELVEARGLPNFRELSFLRYPCTPHELAEARAWAQTAIEAAPAAAEEPEREAVGGLKAAFEARLAVLGITANVVERDDLASAAAVGESTVFVGPDAPRSASRIERIVLHEIEGHLVPRLNAKHEVCALLRVAARGAGEDEEGRALLLEWRAGCWDESTAAGRARRRELGLRHLAAEMVRRGGELSDVMPLLLGYGMEVTAAVRLAERVLRGGGLAREVAYLPAFFRVSRAFEAEPALESWFVRGRVSLEAARVLELHSKSITTGT